MAKSSFDDNILIPGASFHVDLAALDALHPVHYSRRLLIFRSVSLEQRDAQLAALKSGLQALISRCPILAGDISPLPVHDDVTNKPDWRTILPGRGLELVVRDLSAAMPSYDELEAGHFAPILLPYNILVPVPQDISNDRPYVACKFQFSAIRGGSILTIAHSHSVCDGAGTDELTRLLAEEIRLAQEPTTTTEQRPKPLLIGLDRSFLRSITSSIRFNILDHPAYTSSSTAAPPNHPFRAPSSEMPVLLRISPCGLARLKSDASSPDIPYISTHDALAALMWRSVMITRLRRSAAAQTVPPETESSIFMPSDARRYLGLPPSYVGNAVYQLTASLELGVLLSDSGLRDAASALRRAISAVTEEKVRSLMKRTNERWVDWGFLSSYDTTGFAMGTDWTNGPEIYDLNWGDVFGRVSSYRYPGEGANVVFPRMQDGSAEVVISVCAGEEWFLVGEQCFGRYLEA